MMGVTSKSTAADEAGVFGLMAFLADPEKCAMRLAELRKTADAAEGKIADAIAEVDKAKSANDEAMALAAECGVALAEVERQRKSLDNSVEAHKQDVAALNAKLADLKAKDKELSLRASALSKAEEAAAAREREAEQANAEAQAMKEDYEAKLGKLRSLAG